MKYLTGNSRILGKLLAGMYLITALLLFLLALLVQKLQLTDGIVRISICVIYVLSCFTGGFFAGKVLQSRKFLWGMLLGILYMTVMTGITLAAKSGMNCSFSEVFVNLLLCLGSGTLGGMIS